MSQINFRNEVQNAFFASKTKHLVSYVRDERGNPRGAIIACRLSDSDVVIGYSACRHSNVNTWSNDKYDKYKGLYIAMRRAYDYAPINEVPSFMRDGIRDMVFRAKRYFKTEGISNLKETEFVNTVEVA